MNSSFNIGETPTLHFVATEDEQRLSQDLQTGLDQSLRQAEEQPEVAAAMALSRAAEGRLQNLKKAEKSLHQYAREARTEMEAAAEKVLGTIVQSAVEGEPQFTKLSELTTVETRSRYARRALERLVEHMIPLAQIAHLRQESHELLTRARALEKIAQERAERVLGQLSEAVQEEIVLPVDLSKGVVGALLAHAAGLKKLAIQQAENADRIEKSYAERTGKEGSR